MSAVAAINSAVKVDNTLNEFVAYGSVTLSGNYGAANGHGDVLDLSQLSIPSDQVPNEVEVFESPAAGTAPQGKYIFVYCPGTTQANGKLFIYDTSADAELNQGGAYPAGLTGAVISFRAWFASL